MSVLFMDNYAHPVSMKPSHKNLFMLSGFLLFSISSHSRMGILHTQGHRSPHSSPKTTRYTPKIAAFCFVRILMLVFDPPIKISICRAFILLFPTSSQSRMVILHTHGLRGRHRGPHSGPKTTRNTPKVAAFCFVSLLMLVCNPPI